MASTRALPASEDAVVPETDFASTAGPCDGTCIACNEKCASACGGGFSFGSFHARTWKQCIACVHRHANRVACLGHGGKIMPGHGCVGCHIKEHMARRPTPPPTPFPT